MASPDLLRSLNDLGLNTLEAEVYVRLLTHEPTTGYRLGRELERPTANVYKALESLGRKGAVIAEEGEPRSYRALPPEALLRALRIDLDLRSRRAARALADLGAPPPDERVYHLSSASLVLERAASMVSRAEASLVVDAFPGALRWLLPSLQEAAARGVQAHVQAYGPVEIEGVRLVQAVGAEETLRVFRAEQLNVVVDGREALLALLDPTLEHVHQAVWSESRYLAFLLQVGLTREHHVHALLGATPQEAMRLVKELLPHEHHFTPASLPGLGELLARYSPAGHEEPS